MHAMDFSSIGYVGSSALTFAAHKSATHTIIRIMFFIAITHLGVNTLINRLIVLTEGRARLS